MQHHPGRKMFCTEEICVDAYSHANEERITCYKHGPEVHIKAAMRYGNLSQRGYSHFPNQLCIGTLTFVFKESSIQEHR